MRLSAVIADDHPLSAAGLGDALAATGEIEIVATATNGIEAIAQIKRWRPHCTVIDLAMPGASGLEVLIEAQRWSPDTRFAVVTGAHEPALFDRLIEAGAHGLFLKTMPLEAVREGVLRIAHGETLVADEARAVLERAQGTPDLSARELQVLHAITRGLSNRRIGEDLGVSPKTVDSHRTSLMRKLDVNSTATLVVMAMRNGLIGTSQDN